MVTAGLVYHLALTRAQLLRELALRGPEAVLVGFSGTLEDARRAVAGDPRELFVLDKQCDRQDARGACLGHPRPRCSRCSAWLLLNTSVPICPRCGEVGP